MRRKGQSDIMFYFPGDDNWWLGKVSYDKKLNWSLAGNTLGFGHDIYDGRPFWIGDFNGDGKSDVLFYFPGDDNWWLGTTTGVDNKLKWTLVGNTIGFGHAINKAMVFWIGDFNGDGKDDILFYFPGNDNWHLGTIGPAGKLNWSDAGNTIGFGHAINEVMVFWIGDFNGDGKDDILFYFNGDHNWWLGTYGTNNQPNWTLAGNTIGFGNLKDGRPFWIGDFNGDGKDDILFYFNGDHNWWLGTYGTNNQLNWTLAGNTIGFGNLKDGRPFWIGDFNGDGKDDILFYFNGDHNWWLGTYGTNNQLNWTLAGNTIGFGNLKDGRPFWIGNFSQIYRLEILFYFPGDDNWWLGTYQDYNKQFNWTLVSNTTSFGHPISDGRPFWIGNFTNWNSSAPKLHVYNPLPLNPAAEQLDHFNLYGRLRSSILSRHFAITKYFRTNMLSPTTELYSTDNSVINRWRIKGRSDLTNDNPLMMSGLLFTSLAVEAHLGNSYSVKILKKALTALSDLYKIRGNNFDGYILRWDPVTREDWIDKIKYSDTQTGQVIEKEKSLLDEFFH